MRKNPPSMLLTSSISMEYFIPYMERHSLPWERKAKEMGLPLQYSTKNEWIPLKSYSLFIKEMSQHANEDMPICVGRDAAQMFLKGKRKYIEPDHDLKQAITAMLLNSQTMSRQNSFWVEQVNQQWCLCNKGELQPSFPGYEVVEWFRLSLLIMLCRNWLGQDWSPSEVSVMTSKPRGERFESHLFSENTKVNYGQPYLRFELPGFENFESLSRAPLKQHGMQELDLLADSYCHLPSFTLEWLASLFGVTSKTLYRYFKDHNTSFKTFKNNAVLRRTCEFLFNSPEGIADIAYQMGYSDVSNFNRAIKNMCGQTPAQIRLSMIK